MNPEDEKEKWAFSFFLHLLLLHPPPPLFLDQGEEEDEEDEEEAETEEEIAHRRRKGPSLLHWTTCDLLHSTSSFYSRSRNLLILPLFTWRKNLERVALQILRQLPCVFR